MSIVTAVAVVTVIGLLGAAILVVAAHFMHVEEDPRVGEVLGVLPGANCGACGYAGCADYAKAIVEGAPVNKCVPGGAKCAAAAAAIMGVEAGEVVKRKAIVACQGSYDHTQDKYEYEGIESCAACAALYSGRAACEYGCLGYGDCVKACKFDAITVSNGLACESGKMHRLRRLRAGVPQKGDLDSAGERKARCHVRQSRPRRPDAQGLHGRLHRLHEVRKELPGGRHQGDQ